MLLRRFTRAFLPAAPFSLYRAARLLPPPSPISIFPFLVQNPPPENPTFDPKVFASMATEPRSRLRLPLCSACGEEFSIPVLLKLHWDCLKRDPAHEGYKVPCACGDKFRKMKQRKKHQGKVCPYGGNYTSHRDRRLEKAEGARYLNYIRTQGLENEWFEKWKKEMGHGDEINVGNAEYLEWIKEKHRGLELGRFENWRKKIDPVVRGLNGGKRDFSTVACLPYGDYDDVATAVNTEPHLQGFSWILYFLLPYPFIFFLLFPAKCGLHYFIFSHVIIIFWICLYFLVQPLFNF